MVYKHKVKKTSLQITTPENVDNNKDPKRDMDLVYMRNRKRQDLLSKLREWGSWEKVEGERRIREKSREKCISQ